jgi:hypothetical protein
MRPQSVERRTARLVEIGGDAIEVDRTIRRACLDPANGGIRSLERPVPGRSRAVVQVAEARAVLGRLLIHGQRIPGPALVLRPGAGRECVAVLDSDGQSSILGDVDVLSSWDFGNLDWSVMYVKVLQCVIPDTSNWRRPYLCRWGRWRQPRGNIAKRFPGRGSGC